MTHNKLPPALSLLTSTNLPQHYPSLHLSSCFCGTHCFNFNFALVRQGEHPVELHWCGVPERLLDLLPAACPRRRLAGPPATRRLVPAARRHVHDRRSTVFPIRDPEGPGEIIDEITCVFRGERSASTGGTVQEAWCLSWCPQIRLNSLEEGHFPCLLARMHLPFRTFQVD